MDLRTERSLLDALPAATLVLGNDDRIVLVNPAAARLLDRPEPVLLGRPICSILPYGLEPDPDRAVIARRGNGREFPVEISRGRLATAAGDLDLVVLRDAIGQRGEGNAGAERRVARPDAAARWTNGRAAITICDRADACGRPLGPAEAAAERQRLERELREATAAATRLKGRFLATVSHELRTPMTAILGYTHLLLNGLDGELTPEQSEDVAEIMGAAERLLDLVNGILDLSKLEAGTLGLAAEPLDLVALLDEVRQRAADRAAAKGIAIRLDAPPAPIPAVADPMRIRQVLSHLVDNAIKFTERGDVTLSARAANGWVEIDVADTGIGIPTASLPHIFEAFRPGAPGVSRCSNGRGLGLAIAKKLIELHGGTIGVASEPGAGSTFTLRLPTAARTPVSPHPDGGVGSAVDHGGRRPSRGYAPPLAGRRTAAALRSRSSRRAQPRGRHHGGGRSRRMGWTRLSGD